MIRIDIWGPASTLSEEGSKYILCLLMILQCILGYILFTVTSEVAYDIPQFIALLERQSDAVKNALLVANLPEDMETPKLKNHVQLACNYRVGFLNFRRK